MKAKQVDKYFLDGYIYLSHGHAKFCHWNDTKTWSMAYIDYLLSEESATSILQNKS